MYFDLTKRQVQILEFIKSEVEEKGYPPTVREICDEVDLKSTSSVQHNLNTLEKKGYLIRQVSHSRSITILDNNLKPNLSFSRSGCLINLPVVSDFNNDKDLFDKDNISEYIAMPKMLANGDDCFIYINKGNNMKNFGILHKDYVILDSASTVKDGDLVLVLLFNEFTDIKEYHNGKSKVLLKSNNEMVIDKDSVNVLGVVKGVFRA